MQVQAAPQQPIESTIAPGAQPQQQGDGAFADLLGMLGEMLAPAPEGLVEEPVLEAPAVDPQAVLMMAPVAVPPAPAQETVMDVVAATADSVVQTLTSSAPPQAGPVVQLLTEGTLQPETHPPQSEATLEAVTLDPKAAQVPETAEDPAVTTEVPYAVAVTSEPRPAAAPHRLDTQALQRLGLVMQDAVQGRTQPQPQAAPTVTAQAVQAVEALPQQSSDPNLSTRSETRIPEVPAAPIVATHTASAENVPQVETQSRVPLVRLPGEIARVASEEWRSRPEGALHKTVEIRMDPPSLGHVLIRLTEADGAVHAHVEVAHAEVREALQTEMGQLAHQLQQQGISLGSVTVGTSGQGHSDHRPHETGGDWPFELRGSHEAAGTDPPESAAPSAAYDGQINLRA